MGGAIVPGLGTIPGGGPYFPGFGICPGLEKSPGSGTFDEGAVDADATGSADADADVDAEVDVAGVASVDALGVGDPGAPDSTVCAFEPTIGGDLFAVGSGVAEESPHAESAPAATSVATDSPIAGLTMERRTVVAHLALLLWVPFPAR